MLGRRGVAQPDQKGEAVMKKTLLVLLLLLGALLWSFLPQRLDVPQPGVITLPPGPAGVPVQLAVMHTGSMQAKAFFAYRGGGLEDREFGMDVVLLKHPRGLLLIDAGFASAWPQHLAATPALLRTLSRTQGGESAALQLAKVGIQPPQLAGVLLTHAHWDHVSGLADLPGVPVLVNAEEKHFIEHGGEMSALARSLGKLNYQLYDFEHGPYAGFAASHDVFGDGSVIVVPAGGHTPGSVIVFVHSGARVYAFIGDLAWQHEGVDLPAERPWLARSIVDVNPATVRADLAQLHRLAAANPQLLIVPAHDHRVMQTLPQLAAP
ncbi:Glyoxylase, beta-lactamase superfamily II [Solimonas aquatica]|uniref:Glyoxylase, beta-lactamase superfamily II n=2 Tax=Solimonas aquatica TaxID=489703 RepID=A0A1H9CNB8_9GAMM|nr:Glyoxylase, beta-lactamase superfamily II [Solimonas aquatica]